MTVTTDLDIPGMLLLDIYRLAIERLQDRCEDLEIDVHHLQESEEGYADRIADLEAENKELRDFKAGRMTV